MKIVVTGASGLLGRDIADVMEREGHTVSRLMGRRGISVTDTAAITGYLAEEKPDVVIHSAGYRDLDDMEEHPAEGFLLNTMGTRNIALGCRIAGAKLIHISSDTVFDGEKAGGYHEFDRTNPVNVYGRSKCRAEEEIRSLWPEHFIVRTALLFGYKGHRENNFIFHILDTLKTGGYVQASKDQICCPSWTRDIAEALLPMLASAYYGTYHIANSGSASRWEVSREVAGLAGAAESSVLEADASRLRKAKRAKNTTFLPLAYPAAFGKELRCWREALAQCMQEIRELKK